VPRAPDDWVEVALASVAENLSLTVGLNHRGCVEAYFVCPELRRVVRELFDDAQDATTIVAPSSTSRP
jgi:hypothetical protein